MFLSDFQSATAGPILPQTEINRVVQSLMETVAGADLADAFEKYAVGAEFIAQRQVCVMPQAGEGDYSVSVFPESVREAPAGFDLRARMENFRSVVNPVLDQMFEAYGVPPDDLIHATCTGYISPSPAQELALRKGWHDLAVTHSYHMGCYGAFPPVRMATGFLAADPAKRRVEVAHTEFCTNHFDVTKHDAAHLINTTLFSDGFIRYCVTRERSGDALEVLALHEMLIPDSAAEMSWIPGPFGFDMTLARTVPVKIRDHIRDLVSRLCEKAGVRLDETVILAIHPGGPKILDHIQAELEAQDSQVAISRAVLKEHGNMSSATVPHVWQRILEDETIPDGATVISVAFGPGLTATGLCMAVCRG